jgi:hypothetical protein
VPVALYASAPVLVPVGPPLVPLAAPAVPIGLNYAPPPAIAVAHAHTPTIAPVPAPAHAYVPAPAPAHAYAPVSAYTPASAPVAAYTSASARMPAPGLMPTHTPAPGLVPAHMTSPASTYAYAPVSTHTSAPAPTHWSAPARAYTRVHAPVPAPAAAPTRAPRLRPIDLPDLTDHVAQAANPVVTPTRQRQEARPSTSALVSDFNIMTTYIHSPSIFDSVGLERRPPGIGSGSGLSKSTHRVICCPVFCPFHFLLLSFLVASVSCHSHFLINKYVLTSLTYARNGIYQFKTYQTYAIFHLLGRLSNRKRMVRPVPLRLNARTDAFAVHYLVLTPR